MISVLAATGIVLLGTDAETPQIAASEDWQATLAV